MRFKAIASGSNGNSIYIGTEKTHVLVDAGISCKRIADGLGSLDIKPEDLSGIFITHEHSDHIQGLRIFSKKYAVPLYGTHGTLQAVRCSDLKNEIDPSLFREIEPGEVFTVGDISVNSIRVSHDAADPTAYRFTAGDTSTAVMTDLGTYTAETVRFLQGLNGLLLESNHDIRMLETGPYPYALKRRILGDKGHLSNERSGQLLSRVLNPEMKFVLLGHLSGENNYPDIALMSVANEIDQCDNEYRSDDFDIRVASRQKSSDLYEI